MEPRIFSPPSPSEVVDGSFDHSIPFPTSTDSLYPPHSSNDHPDPTPFDTYIAGKVAKERTYHPMSSTPTPPSSERSSMEDSPFDSSPSQATITQAALHAEATRLKKKRSLAQALKSFKTSSRDFTESLRGSKRIPFPLQLDEPLSTTHCPEHPHCSAGIRQAEGEDGFEDRNRTVRRRNMPHHPFRSDDVPYMQAYSQILLENDYQTHQLLCKLTGADSPTFHKFGKKPPADVLDLGCGEGFWVLHAAKLWKSSNTKVTGLDLIDVHNNETGEVHPHREPEHVPKNVTWKRANFVKSALPFPDSSFDLVRMANLTLCIPVNRWNFVLSEVRRVLRRGGRLELVDDDVFFPTILPRLSRDAPRSPPRNQRQRTHAADDVTGASHFVSIPRCPSNNKLSSSLPSPKSSPGRKKGHARTSSDVEFSTSSAIAAHLETIFDNMLVNKYEIAGHPHFFLERSLRHVFGLDCARQTQNLELAVPSRELTESSEALGLPPVSSGSSSHGHGHVKRPSEDDKLRKSIWASLDWEWKEKRSSASSPTPGTRSERTSGENINIDPRMLGSLTPKARQLLFGDGENPNKTPSWRATGPYQPPGLVLLPSTLIPFTPLELEMHASKHMNTLLGCKYALSEYITAQTGEDGKPLLTEREVDDYLWDYECFRRKRFNWPQDIGLQMDDDELEEPMPPTPKSHIFKFASGSSPTIESTRALSADGLSAPMYGGVNVSKQSSTHVRTIRVYEAIKVHQHCACHCDGDC